jgi:AcrR family transcriptional regulator
MKRRAERQQQTRERIVEAAVGLHTTLGPARTSISAIAEQAGVRRQTVYDHFPDAEALFRACSLHWRAAHPFPDPMGWMTIDDHRERVRTALEAVYGWYESVRDEFALFARDSALYPRFWAERDDQLRGLAEGLAGTLPRPDQAAPALAHAFDFATWQSLRRHGFVQHGAIDAMTDFVTAHAAGQG